MNKLPNIMAVFCALLVIAADAWGETLILSTNRSDYLLTIPTNEIVVFSYFGTPTTGQYYAPKLLLGRSVEFDIPAGPMLPATLAGPLFLSFDGRGSYMMEFKRYPATNFYTVILEPRDSKEFSVGTNEVIHFYRPIPATSGVGILTCKQGTNSFEMRQVQDMEFQGPLSFKWISDGSSQQTGIITYSINKDFSDVAHGALLNTTPGTRTIWIEKSHDLRNWSPIMLHRFNDEREAFYRFNSQR
jgi:hypothetical protein